MNWTRAAIVATVVVLCCTSAIPAGGETHPLPSIERTASAADVLVVDASGDGEYRSIGAALDDASDGDTVRVRPGTYRESVTLGANVTLVASRGATLNGTGLGADAGVVVESDSHAAPVVDGVTVTGYPVGVKAQVTTGDWTLRNVTVRNASFQAVDADASTGNWTLRNVTVTNASVGIAAVKTDGDWSVRNATVVDAELAGIRVADSAGDWTVRNATVERIEGVGIDAVASSGDWTVADATVRTTSIGVLAHSSRGNWTVRGSVVANTSASGALLQYRGGIAVSAGNTSGSWRVRDTRFVSYGEAAIVAPEADPAGVATGNSWGGDGPSEDDCRGNVDCGIPSRTVEGTASTTVGSTETGTRTASSATTSESSPTTASSPASPTVTTTERGVTDPTSTGDSGNLPPTLAIGSVALLVVASLAVLWTRTDR